MSAKIYSGYIVDSRFSQSEVERRFAATREALRKEAGRLYSGFVGDIIARLATVQQLQLPMPSRDRDLLQGSSSFFDAANRFLQEERDEHKADSCRFPEHDLDCFWTLYRLPGKGKKARTLCYLSTEQKSFHRIFKKLAPVREYAYWNNSDRPDHLTQRAWDVRGDSWTRALREKGEQTGIFDEMFGGPTRISSASLPLFVANLNRRHTPLARARVQVISDIENNGLSVAVGVFKVMKGRAPEMCEMSRMYFDNLKWMKSPEGQAEIARDARVMAAHLPPLTVEYISGPCPAFAAINSCPVVR